MDDLYPDSMSEGSLTGAADDALKLLAYDTVRRDQQRQIYTGRVQDCPALSMCHFFFLAAHFSLSEHSLVYAKSLPRSSSFSFRAMTFPAG